MNKKNKRTVEKNMSDEETNTYMYGNSLEESRECFQLPRITREGKVTYDQNNADDYICNSNPDAKKSKKRQKQELKFQKIIERSKKREEQKLKKKEEKTTSQLQIEKIKNKINKMEDIKNDISSLSIGIIGNQTTEIANLDVLFFIFYETLKKKNNYIKIKKIGTNSLHESQEKINSQKALDYFEENNILSCISICTVIKYVTPSYKLLSAENTEQEVEEEEKKKKGQNLKQKKKEVPKRFSKLIKNVNNLEKAIAKYYGQFCTIIKENIKYNIIVYVNLLCDLVTVNLYLSKEHNLFQLLIIYANSGTYSNRKFNCNINNKKNEVDERNYDILYMRCLNTLGEIISNDANFFFTVHLLDHFSKFLFKNKNNISPDLLKVFSNLNIREKKMNAKIYDSQAMYEEKGNLDKKAEMELKKKNIGGDLKIIEKNLDKILDELFLIYLCVLREYTHYSSIFIKNVLYAIADYSLYINKYLMDDVLEEIKVIAKDKKTSPSLRINSIYIFLKIMNKIDDNIYIDCSWICDTLLYVLSSTISYFSIGSSFFLFENVNFPISSFLDHRKYSHEKNRETYTDKTYSYENEEKNLQLGNTIAYNDKNKERANFSAEILYCIDMLLKSKNFLNSFQSTGNNLLCRIVYYLYNVALHSDYVISFAILKQIQLILAKFPLVRCLIEKEGTIISCLNDNISIFYQNVLFHSCYFNQISAAAFDLSLNNSDDMYFQNIQKFIEENKRYVKNEMIYFNLSLNEKNFINEHIMMDYNPQEVYKKKDSFLQKQIPSAPFKKIEEVIGKSFITPTEHNISVALQQIPSYMLTANDFVDTVFSPIHFFMRNFQKKYSQVNQFEKKHKKILQNMKNRTNVNILNGSSDKMKHKKITRRGKGKRKRKKKNKKLLSHM